MNKTLVDRLSAARANSSRLRRTTLKRLAAIAVLLPLFQGTCVDMAQRIATTALVDSIRLQVEQAATDAIERGFGADDENP